jgi:biopolymer transport protein ExbD
MAENQFEQLNMVPFIDIMLVLLTIVLTTSSFVASGRIPVNLPQASASAPEAGKVELIELDAAGVLHFGGKPITPEALKARLAPLAKDTPFLLRADKTVQLQRFIAVADLLKQAGFSKVAVQTEAGKS